MTGTRSWLAAILTSTALLSSLPALSQDAADAENRERFRSAIENLQQLEKRDDPDALVSRAQLLQEGLPASETNPLRRPRMDEVERLYEQALATPGEHWPTAAVRLAKITLAKGKGADLGQKAAGLLRRAAAMGSREAAYLLAQMLEQGTGGARDEAGAKALYQMALRSGYGPAGLALARLESDPGRASVFATHGLQLLFQEAKQGSGEAAKTLADHYRATSSDSERLKVAIEWYQRASDLGNAEADVRLGRMRLDPKSALHDPAEARRAFERAARRGSIEAAMILAEDPYSGSRLGVPAAAADFWLSRAIETKAARALILGAEIRSQGGQEGREAARQLLAMALQDTEEDAGVLVALGRYLRSGDLIDRDIPRAVSLFDRAAAKDNVTALYEFARTVLAHKDAAGRALQPIAIERLREAAMRGHVKASVSLGDAHLHGHDVPVSQDEALRWYRKAAESGSTTAFIRLGDYYASRSDAAEITQALEWYRKAADANISQAMIRLGRMFSEGRGVPQDYAIAVTWFSRAAAAGSGPAMVELSTLYARAGGPGHFNLAREALEKAVGAGDRHASIALAKLYVARGELKIAEAMLRKAAEAGIVEAALELAELYLSSTENPEQRGLARRWLAVAEKTSGDDVQLSIRIALMNLRLPDDDARKHGAAVLQGLVQKGNPDAMSAYAEVLLSGVGVERDALRAEALLKRAIQLGQDDARLILANAYRDGDGVGKDPTRAFALYQELYSDDPNDPKVQLALAEAYARGEGVARDRYTAAQFYKQVARHGDPAGQLRLGLAYLYGGGVERDSGLSEQWLSEASKAGLVSAHIQLGHAKVSGLASSIDPEAAFASYLRAAEGGAVDAMVEVGRALLSGFGTQADPALAQVWWERAASLGSVDAMFELYRFHDLAAEPNAIEAERWLRQAAENGHAVSMYRLALLHRQTASEQDIAVAKEWLTKAAQIGYGRAIKALRKQNITDPDLVDDDDE